MRRVWIAVVAALAVAGGVVFWLVRDGSEAGDPARDRVQEFLRAWPLDAADEDAENPAAELTDDPAAAASLMASVNRNLQAESRTYGEISDSAETGEGEEREVTFTTVYNLGEGLPEWRYQSTAVLTPSGEGGETWLIRWDSTLIHPDLADGQTLVRTVRQPERGGILAAGGEELAAVGRVWNVTIWPAMLEDPDQAYEVIEDLDVGIDIKALEKRVAESDPDQAVTVVTLRDSLYEQHHDELNAVAGLQFAEDSRPLAHHARSVVGGVDPGTGEGASGLQGRYQDQLSGTPLTSVVIADRDSGEALETLVEGEGGADGEPVQTTIDVAVQRAAEEALAGQEQGGSIAVLRPSTGEVLALADTPDGYARSVEGQYAPGSGFKVVTSAALLEQGTGPEDVLGCPKYATVDGRQFHNQDEFELGPGTTLHQAFIRSCNTAFIEHRAQLAGAALAGTAEAFGIGGTWDAGLNTFDGSVPEPEGDTELAASLIGQARVQTSPLGMAAVVATVAAGEFHQPVVVPDAVKEPYQPSATLGAGTYEQLRAMMRATVTEGTASALAGVPGTAHAKTGTAEFATGEDGELSTHAWMIGFLGDRDIAFAVLLEDGGSGGSHAGPVAAALLNGIG